GTGARGGRAAVQNKGMDAKPVNVHAALATFDEVYSPRIVARMNDYDVRIAHANGEHVWHVHDDTDEFFLVLDGQFDIALRRADGTETTVVLRAGETGYGPRVCPGRGRPGRVPGGSTTAGHDRCADWGNPAHRADLAGAVGDGAGQRGCTFRSGWFEDRIVGELRPGRWTRRGRW